MSSLWDGRTIALTPPTLASPSFMPSCPSAAGELIVVVAAQPEQLRSPLAA